MDAEQQTQIVEDAARFLGNMPRSPVLKRPSDYGVDYEDVFFPAMDGTVLEGWLIPGDSNRVVICNHFIGATRSGYPGHLPQFPQCDFEVEFIPAYKALNEAGFTVLTYDMRGHGLSACGPAPVSSLGIMESRDVIGSVRYARERLPNASIGMHNICGGCNAAMVAMHRHADEFAGVKAMTAIQPISLNSFANGVVGGAGVENAAERMDEALRAITGFRASDYDMASYAKSVDLPTLMVQVRDDAMTSEADTLEIFNAFSNEDKVMRWIDGTSVRHHAYNFFSEQPAELVEWFDKRV